MRRKVLIFLSLVLLFALYTSNAEAKVMTSNDEIVTFRWDNVDKSSIKLTKSGKVIYFSSSIISNGNTIISGGVYLEKYTNGRWVNVGTWALRGTGTALLSDSFIGETGNLYRARLSASVGGERISATSNSVRL